MLARNFMGAADLGLTDEAYAALLTILGMLERGELVHQWPLPSAPLPDGRGYINMQWWNYHDCDCGTVHCIGGWVEALCGITVFSKLDRAALQRFDRLCYPSTAVCYALITAEQMASALRNYLATGEARWEEVLV